MFSLPHLSVISHATVNTFTNIIGFHTFIDPTNSEFEFFDDGSQTGGTLGTGRLYRLILLSSPPPQLSRNGQKKVLCHLKCGKWHRTILLEANRSVEKIADDDGVQIIAPLSRLTGFIPLQRDQ